MGDSLKYGDITEKIIGCAFEVHKFLGNGFQEVIYQRALALELGRTQLNYAREVEQPIFYKDFAYRFEVGLLINFGNKSLTFKRVVL